MQCLVMLILLKMSLRMRLSSLGRSSINFVNLSAFPGWFKRIVLSQCNRRTRGKRLQIVPLEVGSHIAITDPDPHTVAEKHELLNKVLRAIKALPGNERLVTTLFYVDGYTQADIGQ